MPQTIIRLATDADLIAINDIYNHYVLNSTCTYQEETELITDRQTWFSKHGENHPVTVALLDRQIVGWGSLSPYRPRSAYRSTVENAVYVHPNFHRRGIGSMIVTDSIDRAHTIGHHTIMAIIDADQIGSIVLHEKLRFKKAAHLKQVGFKFGRWLDVIYMQLMLNN
jgi:L-amino acid N-acyltransferase